MFVPESSIRLIERATRFEQTLEVNAGFWAIPRQIF